MLGKTGAGKSLTINMLANLYQDKEYFDERIVLIPVRWSQDKIIECNVDEYKKFEKSEDLKNISKSAT